MEIKDFIKLALKLIAIFYTIDGIYFIARNIQYFVITYEYKLYTVTWTIMTTVIPILMYYLIFVQSDKLIKFLKIDEGFEGQKVQFGNLKSNEILKIAFVIFGLLMIVWGLPNFLTNCFYAFKYSTEPRLYEPAPETLIFDYFEITQSAIYILLGYLMLTNYKRIANWFDK